MADTYESVTATKLWPSAKNLKEHWNISDGGHFPDLSLGDIPAWKLLDTSFENSLKSQLNSLLSKLGSNVPESLDSDVSIDESNGIVHIAEGAFVGPFTRFEGPCYIAPEAEIRHGAYIRGNSWICYQAVLGHASEIKHSILLPNAKAPHFNYVGDSIVGSHANLGAGVILSNLRNDGRETKVKMKNELINTELRKFGALIGERTQIGCNSVSNPGTITAPDCMVWPNTTLSGLYEKKGSKIKN
jgi:NDP-sugar pyrophosphorylase family protein